MFRVLNDNNGRGGVWAQGGGGDDRTNARVDGARIDLSGDDVVLGMGGDDRFVDRGGADTLLGGQGSDRFVETVGGNLILGDETHPNHLGETEGWAARGGGGDHDVASYIREVDGVFVTGVQQWSTLGRELRDDYGLDKGRRFDPEQGETSAYVVQTNGPDRVEHPELRDWSVDAVLDAGFDVLVGIETLVGTHQRDVFLLKAHDDHVVSRGGDDYIFTAAGDDRVEAGRGDDVVIAGDGDDRVNAGRGDDHVDGGTGDDRIRGGAGDDTIDAGDGDDRIRGDHGDDMIVTGDGLDRVTFRAGCDGDDVIADFDVRTRDSEADFDTLIIKWDGQTHRLRDGQDFADFIVFIETDGDRDTDAIQDGDDLVLDFDGSSLRLEGVLDDIAGPQSFRGETGPVEATDTAHGAVLWSDVIDLA